MSTLADGGRITTAVVKEEIQRLQFKWRQTLDTTNDPRSILEPLLGNEATARIDYYDQLKLANLIDVCRHSNSMADAGRKLFNCSRTLKQSCNYSHRVKQLLDKYGLKFSDLR